MCSNVVSLCLSNPGKIVLILCNWGVELFNESYLCLSKCRSLTHTMYSTLAHPSTPQHLHIAKLLTQQTEPVIWNMFLEVTMLVWSGPIVLTVSLVVFLTGLAYYALAILNLVALDDGSCTLIFDDCTWALPCVDPSVMVPTFYVHDVS